MIGYKVVSIDENGTYKSATRCACPGIEYAIGAVTTRENRQNPIGPFAIFDSLLDAKHFLFECIASTWGEERYRILRVEYGQSKGRELWFTIGTTHQELPIHRCPSGTVLAEWVKSLEEVEN